MFFQVALIQLVLRWGNDKLDPADPTQFPDMASSATAAPRQKAVGRMFPGQARDMSAEVAP